MADETPAPTPDDVAAARVQAVQLVGTGSRIAWTGSVVSVIILVAFTGTLILVLVRGLPAASEGILLLLGTLIGTLTAMATQVSNYWLGSSAGSAAKARHIEAMERAKP